MARSRTRIRPGWVPAHEVREVWIWFGSEHRSVSGPLSGRCRPDRTLPARLEPRCGSHRLGCRGRVSRTRERARAARDRREPILAPTTSKPLVATQNVMTKKNPRRRSSATPPTRGVSIWRRSSGIRTENRSGSTSHIRRKPNTAVPAGTLSSCFNSVPTGIPGSLFSARSISTMRWSPPAPGWPSTRRACSTRRTTKMLSGRWPTNRGSIRVRLGIQPVYTISIDRLVMSRQV